MVIIGAIRGTFRSFQKLSREVRREEKYALMTGVDGTSVFASDMLLSRAALTAVVHQSCRYLTIKPLSSFPRFTSGSTPSTQGNRSCEKGKAVLTFLPLFV